MIKTYKLSLQANKTKLQKIKEIAKEHRKTTKTILAIQLRLLFKEGKSNKNHKLPQIETKLSARYLQTLQYQIVSMLESYLSNRQNGFKDIVVNSNLDKDIKIQLLYINKYKRWFNKEIKLKGKLIEPNILKLARAIIKQTFKKNRFPNTKHVHLNLDSKVAKIEAKKENGATEFDYWIKLSTLEKGKPIYTSIRSNLKLYSCGKKINADVNAARNILLRSSQEIGSIYISKSKVLSKLITEFTERHKRVYSCSLAVTNPYFKRFSYG